MKAWAPMEQSRGLHCAHSDPRPSLSPGPSASKTEPTLPPQPTQCHNPPAAQMPPGFSPFPFLLPLSQASSATPSNTIFTAASIQTANTRRSPLPRAGTRGTQPRALHLPSLLPVCPFHLHKLGCLPPHHTPLPWPGLEGRHPCPLTRPQEEEIIPIFHLGR